MEMTPGEIITNYRQSKNPVRQRKVLAELNLCRVSEIDLILGISKSNKKEAKSLSGKINDAEARGLYDEGKSDVDIAAVFGVTAGGVWAWRKAHGLPTLGRVKKEKEDKPMALKVPSIDALPAVVKEKVEAAMAQKIAPDSQQLSPSDPEVNKPVYLPNEYDPLIYDTFDLAIAKTYERGLQPGMVWRQLLLAAEGHIKRLNDYLLVSDDACRCAVELAALAVVEEVCRTEK